MRFDKVLVIIDVQLKADELQQYLPCSANIIGQTLAQIAIEYEQETKRLITRPSIFLKRWRMMMSPGLILI